MANPPASVSEVLPDVTKGLRSKGDISPIGIFAGLGTQVNKMALKGPARSPSEGEAPFPLSESVSDARHASRRLAAFNPASQ
ncbi:hypothetical protein D3227_21845 [Mesorhizobium waimense]|uniref:Uncharacterized protein n=1 Tax=Mesorhizobium waimense TaxID=1300307 RepID=A0A3A5KVG8_9HYPH|nr:hypothetical protein D3227_21845 [Mesorhizobium waimense]